MTTTAHVAFSVAPVPVGVLQSVVDMCREHGTAEFRAADSTVLVTWEIDESFDLWDLHEAYNELDANLAAYGTTLPYGKPELHVQP